MQTEKGQSIEDASMAVIEKEIGKHPYDKMQWPIVRRVIHSTADFDFAGQAIKFTIISSAPMCFVTTVLFDISSNAGFRSSYMSRFT